MNLDAKTKKDKDKKKKDKKGIEKKSKKHKKEKKNKKSKEKKLKEVEKKVKSLKVESMTVEDKGEILKRQLENAKKKLSVDIDEKKQNLSLKRAGLIKKCKENDRILLFYRGEMGWISKYQLPHHVEISEKVSSVGISMEKIYINLQERPQITMVEITSIETELVVITTGLNHIKDLLQELNFASFDMKVEEWRQNRAIMKFIEKKKSPERKVVLRQLRDLSEERDILIRQINNESVVADGMAVENVRRGELLKQVSLLLKIIASPQYLTLYNETAAAKKKFEEIGSPEGEIKELVEELNLLWKRYETSGGNALKTIRQKMMELIPEIETMIKEFVEGNRIIKLTNRITIPSNVERIGMKLFIRMDEKKPLITEDQHHSVLTTGPIDIKYMKTVLMTINNGLFLSESQFSDPVSKNGVFAAQDISKNQIITFYSGKVVRDSELPSNRKVLNMTRLFIGSNTQGIPSWYILGDEMSDGRLVSSDTPFIIESSGIGGAGFIKDCIDLDRMIKNRASSFPSSGGGSGEDSVDEEKAIIVEGGASSEEEEEDEDYEDEDIEQYLSNDQFRPRVKDPESKGATRSCINVALRVYDDRYNSLIREKVSSTDNVELLNLLDPEHTIVVVEALRTIRMGEELFMSYGDTLWSEYMGWFSSPRAPHRDIYKPDVDSKLRDMLALALKERQFIVRVPFVDGVIDPYEPLDDEEEDDEEEYSYTEEDDEEKEIVEEMSVTANEYDNAEDLKIYKRMVRDYEKNISNMESFSSNITYTRKEDLMEVKILIEVFKKELAVARTTDQELEALGKKFVEILIRMGMLTSDDETSYYLAEQNIRKMAPQDATTLKNLRKKIVQLQIDDALNDSETNNDEIAQLNERRRLLLVYHKIEPEKPGDKEKMNFVGG